MIQTNRQTHQYHTKYSFFSKFSTSLNKLPDHLNLPLLMACFNFGASMSISIRTLGLFVSIKISSIDIKLNYFKCFYLSKIDYSKSADKSESSGKSVIIAAVLAWNPGQALSWNPRHALHQREILSWIPRLFSIFVSRIPRKQQKSLPVHCNGVSS